MRTGVCLIALGAALPLAEGSRVMKASVPHGIHQRTLPPGRRREAIFTTGPLVRVAYEVFARLSHEWGLYEHRGRGRPLGRTRVKTKSRARRSTREIVVADIRCLAAPLCQARPSCAQKLGPERGPTGRLMG